MATHTFKVNGKSVSVQAEDDVRMLWVLRDLLGIKGPKYGCGIGVCKACTCHINGKAFNPCSVPVSKMKPTDEIVTIEGLGASVGRDLHPLQEAWIANDVAQCGYCQPGQIMSAAALINDVHAQGRRVRDEDIDTMRNVCRCGTYPRIRDAIKQVSAATPVTVTRKKKKRKQVKANTKGRVKSKKSFAPLP